MGSGGRKAWASILSTAPWVREDRGIAIEDDTNEGRTVLKRKGPEHIAVSCGRNRWKSKLKEQRGEEMTNHEILKEVAAGEMLSIVWVGKVWERYTPVSWGILPGLLLFPLLSARLPPTHMRPSYPWDLSSQESLTLSSVFPNLRRKEKFKSLRILHSWTGFCFPEITLFPHCTSKPYLHFFLKDK